MVAFRGQASWAKNDVTWGKLATLACHPTKKVNKAKELTYLWKKLCIQSFIFIIDLIILNLKCFYKCVFKLIPRSFPSCSRWTEAQCAN